jgi:hypothetical protein
MSKGGKREGAGRPVAPPSAVIRIRLPLTEHEQVAQLGGVVWVKRVLREELSRCFPSEGETFK